MSDSVDMNAFEERLFVKVEKGNYIYNDYFKGWLDGLPDPMSPQERYEMGLNPKVDHPLHPRPFKQTGLDTFHQSMRCPDSYKPQFGGLPEMQVEFKFPGRLEWNESSNFVFYGMSPDPEVPALRGYLSTVDPLGRDEKEFSKPNAVHHEGPQSGLEDARKKRIRVDKGEEERPSKRAKIVDTVKQLSNRFSSINLGITRPEQPSTERAKKRHSMLPAFTTKTKDTVKRAGSTRGRRLSQLWGKSEMKPLLTPEVAKAAAPPRQKPEMGVNIVVLGDAAVGKTQLLRAWANEEVSMDNYTPTDNNPCYAMEVKVDNMVVLAKFHEHGSALPEGAWHPLKLCWNKCIIYCYDIDREETLASIDDWKEFSKLYESASVLVLAGLKKDLRRTGPGLALSGFLEQGKQVTAEQGVAKMAQLEMTTHAEVSVKDNDGVAELFDLVVRASVRRELRGREMMRKSRQDTALEDTMAAVGKGLKSLLHLDKKK